MSQVRGGYRPTDSGLRWSRRCSLALAHETSRGCPEARVREALVASFGTGFANADPLLRFLSPRMYR